MNIKQLITNLILCLALAQGYAWAEDMPAAPEEQNGDTPSVSNVEVWQEETSEEDQWTYFGMGWESRRSVMQQGQGAAGNATATSRGGGRGK